MTPDALNPFHLEPTSDATAPSEVSFMATPQAATHTDDEVATSSASLEALQHALAEAEAKHSALYDQFLRLSADFDNARKRRQSEREQWLKYGAEPTLQALLPVLDTLQRAGQALNDTMSPETLLKHVHLMQQQLDAALADIGLQRMVTQGQPFDARLHEAVASHPQANVAEGTILHEQQAGYHLHDKVLRPALVVVATSPTETPSV
jgi:molecular chaperone GrpE